MNGNETNSAQNNDGGIGIDGVNTKTTSRPSKLKRRKRRGRISPSTTNTGTSNPLSQFAAGSSAGDGTGAGSSSGADVSASSLGVQSISTNIQDYYIDANSNASANANTNADAVRTQLETLDKSLSNLDAVGQRISKSSSNSTYEYSHHTKRDVKDIPSTAKLLNLNKETFSQTNILAQIDYFIQESMSLSLPCSSPAPPMQQTGQRQRQSARKRKRKSMSKECEKDQDLPDNFSSIQHPTLSTIVLNSSRTNRNTIENENSSANNGSKGEGEGGGHVCDGKNRYEWCDLAFPSCDRNRDSDTTNHKINTARTSISTSRIRRRNESESIHEFLRGDGTIVSDHLLAFPQLNSSSNLGLNSTKPKNVPIDNEALDVETFSTVKWIKIESKQGATIRSEFDINDSITTTSNVDTNDNANANEAGTSTCARKSEVLGKISLGSIRRCTGTKWLFPPSLSKVRVPVFFDDDRNHLDDEDESKLVPVMRYRICLIPDDIDIRCGCGCECTEGWISGKSRLDDDPYVIAKLLN